MKVKFDKCAIQEKIISLIKRHWYRNSFSLFLERCYLLTVSCSYYIFPPQQHETDYLILYPFYRWGNWTWEWQVAFWRSHIADRYTPAPWGPVLSSALPALESDAGWHLMVPVCPLGPSDVGLCDSCFSEDALLPKRPRTRTQLPSPGRLSSVTLVGRLPSPLCINLPLCFSRTLTGTTWHGLDLTSLSVSCHQDGSSLHLPPNP